MNCSLRVATTRVLRAMLATERSQGKSCLHSRGRSSRGGAMSAMVVACWAGPSRSPEFLKDARAVPCVGLRQRSGSNGA